MNQTMKYGNNKLFDFLPRAKKYNEITYWVKG